MPLVKADIEQEERELQTMIDSDPEIKAHIAAFDAEYEFRKKLLLARKEAGLTQKQLGMMSGLDYRAISRAESNSDVSPNLKTLVRYLNAVGCELEIVKKVANQ